MKGIKEYIIENKDFQRSFNESKSSTVINKLKKEFKNKFDNKVTIGSGRANFQQLYDVYVYDDSFDTLKEVNDIIKKYIGVWKEFTDDELKKKIDEKHEFLKKHSETIDRYPIEFCRLSSSDLNKL